MEDIRFPRTVVGAMAYDLDHASEILAEMPDATLALLLVYRVLAPLIDSLTN